MRLDVLMESFEWKQPAGVFSVHPSREAVSGVPGREPRAPSQDTSLLALPPFPAAHSQASGPCFYYQANFFLQTRAVTTLGRPTLAQLV